MARGGTFLWLGILAALVIAYQMGRTSGPPTDSSLSVPRSPVPALQQPDAVVSPNIERPIEKPIAVEDPAPPVAKATHLVSATSLRIRALPDAAGEVLGSLSIGQAVAVLRTSSGWALVDLGNRRTGWVSAEYLAAIGSDARPQNLLDVPKAPAVLKPAKPAPLKGQPLRDAYVGTCDCPYDVKRNGASCGRTSAYSRPGGRSPACYVGE